MNNLSLISPVAWANHPTYTIEALESNFGSPLYSTQFHPETGTVGMYSIVYKTISYKPDSAASVEINSKIFVAFGAAAISFHLKKGLLFSATKSNYSDVIAEEASSKTDQKEIKISTSSLSVYSLFMESQIKPHNLNEYKDKRDLECARPATLI